MLFVWVAGGEGVFWMEYKAVKDEDEAIKIMTDRGIWPDQMLLIDDHMNITSTNSDFTHKFNTAWQDTCARLTEEQDLKEYKRLKRKYGTCESYIGS
ncbi:MAG TPA: hypothetical protein VEP90_24835 [Methylomirabilota bacterium]|nr:hypothetical protein [Methylomirabilota bacterium]